MMSLLSSKQCEVKFFKVWRLKFNVWSFLAISSRSDNTTRAHRSCQGLLGLLSSGVQLSVVKPVLPRLMIEFRSCYQSIQIFRGDSLSRGHFFTHSVRRSVRFFEFVAMNTCLLIHFCHLYILISLRHSYPVLSYNILLCPTILSYSSLPPYSLLANLICLTKSFFVKST